MPTMGDGGSAASAERTRLTGILCTYRRLSHAIDYLDRLARQSRPPDLVVVVDNGSDSELRRVCEARSPESFEVRYVDPGENIGPAGAFHRGVEELAPVVRGDDLIVHFDDDDPPVRDDLLERLGARLDEGMARDDRLGGVGLSGGRLSRWTGVVHAPTRAQPLEAVDHLHGGYLPTYRAAALLDVGGNDPSYFYGFEELELGRRLTRRGWRLSVDNELMDELRAQYPKRVRAATHRVHVAEADLGWSRFHKERNLIRVLRREGWWPALATTVVLRHLVKPLLALPTQPRAARDRLTLGYRASVAGLTDRGGIDPRYPPPARTPGEDAPRTPR